MRLLLLFLLVAKFIHADLDILNQSIVSSLARLTRQGESLSVIPTSSLNACILSATAGYYNATISTTLIISYTFNTEITQLSFEFNILDLDGKTVVRRVQHESPIIPLGSGEFHVSLVSMRESRNSILLIQSITIIGFQWLFVKEQTTEYIFHKIILSNKDENEKQADKDDDDYEFVSNIDAEESSNDIHQPMSPKKISTMKFANSLRKKIETHRFRSSFKEKKIDNFSLELKPFGRTDKAKGFENAGNTCYVDSLLNAMFISTNSFDYLFKPLVKSSPVILSLQNSLLGIVNMMRTGQLVEKSVVRSLFVELNNNGFSSLLGSQDDTHDLYLFILDQLEGASIKFQKNITHSGDFDVNDSKFETRRSIQLIIPYSDEPSIDIESLFMNQMNESIQLQRMKDNAAQNIEAEASFQIFKNLVAGSEYMTQDEQKLYKCNSRYSEIITTISLHLKRFDFVSGIGVKINSLVTISEEFDVTRYIIGKGAESCYKLVLKSAVVHMGESLESGHFISYVKGTKEDEWFEFDDTKSKPSLVIDKSIMHSVMDRHGYLVFYDLVPYTCINKPDE